MKIASIDIGTNAVKTKIFETGPTLIKFIQSERSPIRLGKEVFIEGQIPKEKLDQLVAILKNYKEIFESLEVRDYEIVATCAFRDTKNSEEARRFIEHSIEHPIRIISGLEEAKLMRLHPDAEYNQTDMFVDLGGGSTEIFMREGSELAIGSFNLGAVRNMLGMDKPSEWKRLQRFLEKHKKPERIIGIGGNIRSFIYANNVKSMNQNKFLKSAQAMQSLSIEEKMDQFNFSPDRADVIDHAIIIFSFIMQKSGCKKIKSTKWGVSDSIAVKLFHEIYSKKIKIIN
ncbi:MAG: phosphatase [Proteobacteria bacterium]|nr:phosphatase [Pseudomonadota bacterium]